MGLQKDEIIARFKKVCPQETLDTFKDDENLWNYLVGHGVWKDKGIVIPDTINKISKDVFTGSNN